MNPIVIKLGGYQKPASVHTRAAVRFGQVLEQKLGDRIRFELVGDVLALGRKSGDLPRMVESGELSLCYISTVRFTPAVPEFKLLELPFVVRDRNSIMRALAGELGDLYRNRMRDATPFRLLGLWDNGFRQLSNKVRPIRTPGDCRGIRIRTQMSELHGEAFRALGFEPIPADVKEFVEEIGTDRFQAQDNPLTNIFNFGVHRHHRYITLSGHFFGMSALICNASHYHRWPLEVQTAVEAAAVEATALQRQLAAAEDDEIMAQLDTHQKRHRLSERCRTRRICAGSRAGARQIPQGTRSPFVRVAALALPGMLINNVNINSALRKYTALSSAAHPPFSDEHGIDDRTEQIAYPGTSLMAFEADCNITLAR